MGRQDRTAPDRDIKPRNDRRLAWAGWAACLVVALIIGLRLYALRSDPYPRLDWSAGLLTDEGFYIHNARNVVLFGHAVTDEFNNMLLAPLLHQVQVAVFSLVGVGSVQARMISVVFSLASIALLWDAMRRVYSVRAANAAAIVLGLDHTNLLFSRMALMDPFASFGAVLAFRLFVAGRIGVERLGSAGASPSLIGGRNYVLLALAGMAIGATVLNRSICAFLVPAPFVAAACGKAGRGVHLAILAGLSAAILLWLFVWWAPNRAEIGRVGRYYRVEQVQPKSLEHLWNCLFRGAFGDHRGISPYLFRHTPVVFGMVLAFVGWWAATAGKAIRRTNGPAEVPDTSRSTSDWAPNHQRQETTAYLVMWLVLGWLAISASAYSPARYYVSTYPAMAAIAGLAYDRLPGLAAALGSCSMQARCARGLLAAFLAFHAVGSVVHRGGVVGPVPTVMLLAGVPLAAGLGAGLWRLNIGRVAATLGIGLPIAWGVVNGVWMADWLRTLRYSQYEMSRELGQALPPDSVLIGDVAPGICLDNNFMAINVIPGLCNGDRPVERFSGKPRHIVILDGRWKEAYWLERYPDLVDPERRLIMRRVLRWDIGVYPVGALLGPDGTDGAGSPDVAHWATERRTVS